MVEGKGKDQETRKREREKKNEKGRGNGGKADCMGIVVIQRKSQLKKNTKDVKMERRQRLHNKTVGGE